MSATTTEAQDEDEEFAYPLVGWRFAFNPQEPSVALYQVAIAQSLDQVAEALDGAQTPSLNMAITARQCRDLAADLVEVARRLDGGKKLV